jgi:hypothetical protein
MYRSYVYFVSLPYICIVVVVDFKYVQECHACMHACMITWPVISSTRDKMDLCVCVCVCQETSQINWIDFLSDEWSPRVAGCYYKHDSHR